MRTTAAVTTLILTLVLGVQAATAATLKVDDDRAQCRDAGYTRIQPAIDAAEPGDTILVCRAVYREQLEIPEGKDDLTLQSRPLAPANSAEIRAPAGGLPSIQPLALLTIRADRVAVRGLRFTGALASRPEDRQSACLAHTHPSAIALLGGASAQIESNVMQNVANDCRAPYIAADICEAPCPQGTVGAGVHTGDGGTDFGGAGSGDAVIENNTIIGPSAVIAEVDERSVVRGNELRGTSRARGAGVHVVNEFEQFGRTEVRDNRISGFETGVWMNLGSNVLTAENIIKRNGTAVRAEHSRGEIRANFIQYNVAGIDLTPPTALFVPYSITGNRVSGSATNGIRVRRAGAFLRDNVTYPSGGIDCFDESRGTGTGGTGNVWENNVGVSDSPDGICSRP